MRRTLTPFIFFSLSLFSVIELTAQIAYITSHDSNYITVIDLAAQAIVDTIVAGEGPYGIDGSPNEAYLYVANRFSNNVSIINTATREVVDSIAVGEEPRGLAVSADGSRAYTTNRMTNDVSVIDLNTRTAVATIPVNGQPFGVDVSPDGNTVYVSCSAVVDNITVIDANTNTVTATISLPGWPRGLEVSKDGNLLYFGVLGDSKLRSLNTTTLMPEPSILNVGQVFALAESEDGNTLYVCSDIQKKVSIVDVPTRTIKGVVDFASGVNGISLSSDGKYAVVIIQEEDKIAIIDTETYTADTAIVVGGGPLTIGDFVFKASPSGDICPDAIAIDSLFGFPFDEPQVSGIYDNTGYGTNALDPQTGLDCFADEPALQNSIWYTFQGDGDTYRIRTVACDVTDYITDGNTQIAIYTGVCDTLASLACSEDEDFEMGLLNGSIELSTEAGTAYFMLIDGAFETDSVARGEFCVEATRLNTSAVTDIQDTDIGLYPNPTSGHLSLRGGTANRVTIYDGTGRLVATHLGPLTNIDLSGLARGIYMIRLDMADEIISARVAKE